jgi:hypothetical protein
LRACSACLTASFSASFTGVPAGIRPPPGGAARDSKQGHRVKFGIDV